jgi:hypothetical protein
MFFVDEYSYCDDEQTIFFLNFVFEMPGFLQKNKGIFLKKKVVDTF